MKVSSQLNVVGNKPRTLSPFPGEAGCRRAFTLLELLTVMAIIGVLAGLVVGLAPLAAGKMRESRLRAELASLVTSIENYKARFGIYPPDNYDSATGTTDSALAPLFYELSGVIVSNSPTIRGTEDGGFFITVDDGQRLEPNWVETIFRREGFVNAATQEQRRRLFRHSFKSGQHAQIYGTTTAAGYKPLEILTVGFAGDATGRRNDGFAWPLNDPVQPVPTNPGLNPWHYVSSNPTNNPGTFDLWAEVRVKGKTRIFGNWKQ